MDFLLHVRPSRAVSAWISLSWRSEIGRKAVAWSVSASSTALDWMVFLRKALDRVSAIVGTFQSQACTLGQHRTAGVVTGVSVDALELK